MSRSLRLDYPGARHHVFNRGARHAPIFGDDEARAVFVEALAELPERFGLEIHAWALMDNHYHLVVRSPQGNLSRAMRHLGAATTQRLNARHDWDGPVFRGRFKNRVVADDRYWMHLLAYVHLNPVPALAAHPEAWRWSSHRAYLGLEPVPAWLTTATYLDTFGDAAQLKTYVDEHLQGRGTLPEGWEDQRAWDAPSTGTIGTPLVDAYGHRGVDDVMADVAAVTGQPLEALLRNRRGRRDNRARWLLAWWMVRRTDLKHREIAHYLECSDNSVSNMLQRIRNTDDAELAGWMTALKKRAKQTRKR